MNVVVIGAGYVGLVTAAGLAHSGHRVTCIDINQDRIDDLRRGRMPFYEPGLDRVVLASCQAQRLAFSVDAEAAVRDAKVVMIAVGTPPLPDGSADLSQVFAVARQLAPALADRAVVVMKSTVPVGTTDQLAALVRARTSAQVSFASNPEFLREGQALGDFFHPDRIIIGTHHAAAEATLCELYASVVSRERILVMDVCSAELTKHAANAMLATRISFMNEMSQLAERAGADIEQIRRGIGSDERIGPRFLQAGAGFGGSCFPKDLRALMEVGRSFGVSMSVVGAAWEANQRQKHVVNEKLRALLGPLAGRRIAVWGLAFKPQTDDVRESPAVEVIERLLGDGAVVTAYDPVAMDSARRVLGDSIRYATDPYDCCTGADALVLMTEWPELCAPDVRMLRERMRGDVLIDGRNAWSGAAVANAGFWYASIGRGTAAPVDASFTAAGSAA
jgi:UDPglucose 6-dehydrogenase